MGFSRQEYWSGLPLPSLGKSTGVACHCLLRTYTLLLLLLSRFSRVRLVEAPWTAVYQAALSMGFSRQEYWSGLPLPSLVKGFGIVNKAEIDVFLKLSCFFDDPADVGNLISGSSAFSKTSLNIRKFTVHILLKPGLENFEHYFTSTCGEGNGKPLQYSCLENPMDGGAW